MSFFYHVFDWGANHHVHMNVFKAQLLLFLQRLIDSLNKICSRVAVLSDLLLIRTVSQSEGTSCLLYVWKQSQNAHWSANAVRPPSPSSACVCRFASESGGWWGPECSATWTRLMSLSRHTDLCCNTHGRHHKLSHQFSPIGCGMSWITQFVEKCTCFCFPSL